MEVLAKKFFEKIKNTNITIQLFKSLYHLGSLYYGSKRTKKMTKIIIKKKKTSKTIQIILKRTFHYKNKQNNKKQIQNKRN